MTRYKIRSSIRNVLAGQFLEGDLHVVLTGVHQPDYLHNEVKKPESLHAPRQPDYVVVREYQQAGFEDITYPIALD